MRELPCPPALWPRFSALLDEVIDLPDTARAAWLNALRGEDALLREWLTRVLAADPAFSTAALLRPAGLGAGGEAFASEVCVGPYRLIARLGEGGMGEVWRATRIDAGPQREVALKLPYPELLSGPYRQRFDRERDVLAALSHPHIAHLYDAGSSAEGHPYLALELVQGQHITAACRDAGATLDRRIDLVLQVLDGLAYAHQRLIVHRDIKPSNVLVTPEGQAKLLDFGIAKLLGVETGAEAALTQPMARLATPAYAAPEQVSGGAITVATDVFSVGVLLFELCTGHRPFDRLPVAPDAAPAPLASSRADAAAAGMADGRALARRLRGDLDGIIAQAIAWNPAARYSSAEAFAADLRRWQAGLPVRARRIGWAGRTRKFVGRNRLGVGLGGVLALAVAGGTAGIAWQARRAEAEAARANAIKSYLLDLFQQGDPRSGRSIVSMTAKDLLDIGADRADAAFARDPATEIELLPTLAEIYLSVSDTDRAKSVQLRAVDLARKQYGPTDARTLEAILTLVGIEQSLEDEDGAKAQLAPIRGAILAQFGPESLQWAKWLTARALALTDTHGGRDEAIADDRQAIAIFARYFPDDPHYAEAVEDLSDYLYDAEQCAASLATLDQARDILRAQHRFDPLEQLQYWASAASRLSCLGRRRDSDAMDVLERDAAERQLGRQSMWYIHAVTGLALNADLAGEPDRAFSLLQGLLAGRLTNAAATGMPTSARREYGAALMRAGRAKRAVTILEAALAETRLHAKDESNLRRTELFLGDAYDQVGRAAEARVMLKAARDEFVRDGNPGGTFTLSAQERWGRFLLEHGDPQAATAEFNAVLAAAHGVASAATARAAAGLARVALAAGTTAAAEAWSARAMALMAAATGQYDVRFRVDVWLARAQVLGAEGRMAEARLLAAQAVTASEHTDVPESPRLARARAVLGSLGT
jgi:serine/threonine-protein kinase